MNEDKILIKPVTAGNTAASIGTGCSTVRVADDELSPRKPFNKQLRLSHFLAVEVLNISLPERITS